MAMFSVAAILAQGITGRLLDRGWRKPCLLTAVALLIAVSAAFGMTARLGWLVQASGYRPAFALASSVLALGSWAFWRRR